MQNLIKQDLTQKEKRRRRNYKNHAEKEEKHKQTKISERPICPAHEERLRGLLPESNH